MYVGISLFFSRLAHGISYYKKEIAGRLASLTCKENSKKNDELLFFANAAYHRSNVENGDYYAKIYASPTENPIIRTSFEAAIANGLKAGRLWFAHFFADWYYWY